MTRYYRKVELDENGETNVPVSLVGIYPLRWGEAVPDCALIETDLPDDLLAACKAALKELRRMRDSAEAAWYDLCTPETAITWDALKAAIAKAEAHHG